MSVVELISEYWNEGLIMLLLAGGLVEITPIHINPISAIIKKIGKIANAEVVEKVDNMDKKLESHIAENSQDKAEDRRYRILRAADELQNGGNFSKDHFNQLLGDAQKYESYCEAHPEFKNKIAEHSIALIEKAYDDHLQNDGFL